jgi:hypothetical protein
MVQGNITIAIIIIVLFIILGIVGVLLYAMRNPNPFLWGGGEADEEEVIAVE